MSYFLTDDQEEELNLFLDEQNRKVCEDQLNDEMIADELKEIIRATLKADSPIPAFNPVYGYYTVSFTPCEEGNRIYVHHHLTGVSKAISDPAQVFEELQKLSQNQSESPIINESEAPIEEPSDINAEIVESDPDLDGDLETIFTDMEKLSDANFDHNMEKLMGSPPEEVLEELGLKTE